MQRRSNQIAAIVILLIAGPSFFLLGHSWKMLGAGVVIGVIYSIIYAPIFWRRLIAYFLIYLPAVWMAPHAAMDVPRQHFASLGLIFQYVAVVLATAYAAFEIRDGRNRRAVNGI